METPMEIGIRLARKLFQKRGNHSEVHLNEAQLAAILALAAEEAREQFARVLNGRS